MKRPGFASPRPASHLPLVADDLAFLVVVDALPEVPDAPVSSLGVVVERVFDELAVLVVLHLDDRGLDAGTTDTPPIDADTTISGTPTYVGLACNASPPPAGEGVALVERGVCTFQEKLDNITAAGYDAGIVFNAVRPDCMSQVLMLAAGDIPFVFVTRLTGLQLLQVPGVTEANACTTASPAAGSPVASTTIEAIFDGWGYIRLFRTQIPGDVGAPGSISQIDTFTIPEAQDPAFATGFGDLSVHEVAIDPNPARKLAYISYYAGGFRILRYGNAGLQEVGAFIDEGGNNFWGVEVHKIGSQQYVLASDRDFGLYIFQPDL